MKRNILITLGSILALISLGWVAQNRILASKIGESAPVVRGDLIMGVEATGTLSAVVSDRLGPPQIADKFDFKISMMAAEGAEVKAGQPVLGFDVSDLQRLLEEKTAERDSARTQIEKARADLKIRGEDEQLALAQAEARMRKAELKLEAPEELQGANERREIELERDLARREIEHRKGRLSSFAGAAREEILLLTAKENGAAIAVADMQDQIGKMSVKAPRAGTVVYVTNWRSEKKKVGDNVWRMEKVIEIPDLRSMMANGEVDESDAGKVQMGQRLTLKLDAHPDEEFGGSITAINKTVQRQSPQTPLKVLKIEIALDKTDTERMRPGMRFRARLETGRAKNVLLIPHDAVHTTADGPVAMRKTISGQERVSLELGRRNDEHIEVLSGLSEGDRVLLRKGSDEEEGERS
ncbi:MAG TPA: efflux RND transporter periplasmic adaptor subunit [Thermoanaerobaculia bacterium]|nr:efflux RND transporter periplasmic adaptor subunit [Thermoanaerobaculia bacterium]